MLVLYRDQYESVNIGDDIEIKILRISRDKVRLGIAAPKEMPVLRTELYEKIKKSKQQEKENENGNGR